MAFQNQWTHDYPDGQKAHIVTVSGDVFQVVVFPRNPPLTGSLRVEVAADLESAMAKADEMAVQESKKENWKSAS